MIYIKISNVVDDKIYQPLSGLDNINQKRKKKSPVDEIPSLF
ncbi:hypothetical protein ACMA1I_09270 [Pontibacter sp. 13R65]